MNKRRGRRRIFSAKDIARDLQLALQTCAQKKTAVSRVAERYNCSQATVYRLVREQRRESALRSNEHPSTSALNMRTRKRRLTLTKRNSPIVLSQKSVPSLSDSASK